MNTSVVSSIKVYVKGDNMNLRDVRVQSDEVEFEFVSIRHAALLLGVTENTIRRLINEGVIESRKLAFTNVPLVTRLSIEKYALETAKRS